MLFLGIWLCLSFVLPLHALGGPINADDDAELVTPTLEVTTIPTGAAAIAHNLSTNQTYYYRINGNILSSNDDEILSEPGWMPERASTNGVIGEDNRIVAPHLEDPFSAIARIRVIYPNGQISYSTAAMISPNAALTAAHCLYNSQRGGWPTHIEVSPAINGSQSLPNEPFGYTTAKEIVISIPYYESGNSYMCDWGVIRLNSNIGNYSGFVGFQCISPNLANYSVMISGYPGKINRDNGTINQYMQSGVINSDESSQTTASNHTSYETRGLVYMIDTEGGQSGSPILYYNNSEYQIIGIHSEGTALNDGDDNPDNDIYINNKGFGLTSQVFHFLLSYRYNS